MEEFEDPQWLRALVLGLAALVAAFGAAGLFLAAVGHYSLTFALILGAILFIGLGFAARPLLPKQGTVTRAANLCAVAAVVAILGITVWNVSNSSQHVLIIRDGGTYLNAGKWLSAHNTLEVKPFVGPFAEGSGVGVSSPGAGINGDRLDFLLEHMFPVLLAEAQGIGGDGFMYALTPILGGVSLLAFYALARRILRYPIAALGAMLCLAFLMPQLSFSRDSMTEVPVQVLLFTGVWMLCDSRTLFSRRTAFAAGIFLGLVQAMHIDGLAFLIGLPFIGLVVWLRADAEHRRLVARSIVAGMVGVAAGVALGFLDLHRLDPGYLRSLRRNVDRLTGAIVLSLIVAVLLAVLLRNWGSARSVVRARFERAKPSVAFFASEVVLIGGFGAWFVRPLVQTTHGTANTVVGNLQTLHGMTLDPTRRYFEHAVEWTSWYLGPVTLALAIIAAAVATRLFVRGDLKVPIQIVAFALGPPALLYLWRPSITPDQVWVTRRFLPAVFPLLVLAAFGLLCFLTHSDHLGWPELRRLGAVVVGIAAVAFPIYTVVGVSQMTDQRGFPRVIDDVCNRIGHTGAVILPQELHGTIWLYGPQTIRSFCDVPVGVAYSGDVTTLVGRVPKGKLSAPVLRKLALDWATEGRALYIIANSPQTITKLFPGTEVTVTDPETNPHLLTQTLTERPGEYRPETLELAIAKVPLPLR